METTLKDYKKIRTPFAFFDETGSINDDNNRIFGLGMIKVMQPYYLEWEIRLIRQRYKFFDEIKWNTISKNKLEVLKEIITTTLEMPGIYFSAHIIDKDNVDFEQTFSNDPYKAYQVFTEDLIKQSIGKNEVLTVLADYVSDPKSIKFEVDLKHSVNESLGRLAVAGVYRMDSKGSNLIEMVDILLGAIVYEFKKENKLVSGDKNKLEIMEFIKAKLEIKSFDEIQKKQGKFVIFRQ